MNGMSGGATANSYKVCLQSSTLCHPIKINCCIVNAWANQLL